METLYQREEGLLRVFLLEALLFVESDTGFEPVYPVLQTST